ncbi:TonB-dependent receptor [Desulfuromonas sp. AOP6]|uniref:TonB-dependent receptor n=1 Tax=Desulfuromonas sp. AOP6 TaxID=1566351 RepID=UPI0012881B3C|nr:TonB-dependent receptor [Desulfuromonas sp. AOP6]BCA79039.1 TonB-dependent receptor [Desulfuromonas sp. AOP6]
MKKNKLYLLINCFLLVMAMGGSAWAQEKTASTADEALELDELSVSATRSNTAVGKTPQKITIVTRKEIEDQLLITRDQGQVLGNLIPSYSPSRQKLTSSGETFRGRSTLFMIDGVPQSTPLRDSARDAYTIDLEMVERIEIIHGASAEHGLGATGGIINFVTRRPQSATAKQHAGVRITAPTDYDSEGMSYEVDYRVEGSRGNWDLLAAASYKARGLFYDADGEPIGVDGTQGDIMDSDSHDVMLKLGYWFDENQNLELTLNRFYLEGDHDYVPVPGDRSEGIAATSRQGSPAGDAPRNESLTTSLAYTHDNLAGNKVALQLYGQRFRARFGGGTFASFQDPNIDPSGELFDQSQNESDKLGGKLTVSRDGLLANRLKLTGGMDVLQDETKQVLAETGREWVPETRFRNYAPFLQAELRPLKRLTLHGGARYEYAKLDVDTFRTIYSTNPAEGGVTVEGGSPSFDETLFNIGAVYQATEWAQIFGNYSEGFGMPDVGRVLRGIGQTGQDVDNFLDLQPILTDNREIGLRLNWDRLGFEVSYFESDSDLGSRLDNVGGIFEVRREKTEIKGVEASARLDLTEVHRLKASYANIDGRYDSNGDGKVDKDLDGRNISPDRFTARWQARWTNKLNTHLQASFFFDKDHENPELNFNGYELLDAGASYLLPMGRLTVGVENLLNEDYVTYYSQSATTRDDQYFKGRGRTVTLGYDITF